jgi:hypothetical protein
VPGRGYADADTYGYADHHTQRDSNVHADSYAKCDSKCYPNSDAKSNPAAAADPASPPNAAVTCKSFFCRGSSQLPLQMVSDWGFKGTSRAGLVREHS